MRSQQLIPLVALILWSSSVTSWGLFKRAALVVTKPISGDTIVAQVDAEFDFEWQHSTENNVTISLRQGTAANMTLIHVITGMSGLPLFRHTPCSAVYIVDHTTDHLVL
jgi:hypothetical protein